MTGEGQLSVRIDALPESALEAASAFQTVWMDPICQSLGQGCAALVVIVPPAPYDHSDWRRAVVRDLARAYAPQRVNLIAGQGDAEIAAATAYLANAPGVTGQYLLLDSHGAGNPAG